mgnify:CR=1 FL=1
MWSPLGCHHRRHQLRLHPLALGCPIVGDSLYAPPAGYPPTVVDALGITYERVAIERWLQDHNTSPLTGERLGSDTLIPNVILRGLIHDLLERKPELLTAGQTGAAFANL